MSLDLQAYFTKTLAEQPEDYLNQRRNKGIQFTTETQDELQTKKYEAKKLIGTDLTFHIQNLFNPSVRYVTRYVYLSLPDAYEQTDPSLLKFDINYLTPLLQRGILNVNEPIKDIMAMRLDRVIMNGITRTDLFERDTTTQRHQVRYTLLIEELKAQSFISPNGQRFHWVIEPSRSKLLLNPTGVDEFQHNLYQGCRYATYSENRGWYRFASPISRLDTLSLRLANLNGNKDYPPEIIEAVVTQNSNPATLTFNFSIGLALYAGWIQILNFTTGNTVADAALITAMNTYFYSTVDYFGRTPLYGAPSLTQLSVPVNLTTMTPVTGTLRVRIRIQAMFNTRIEFVCLKDTDEYDKSNV